MWAANLILLPNPAAAGTFGAAMWSFGFVEQMLLFARFLSCLSIIYDEAAERNQDNDKAEKSPDSRRSGLQLHRLIRYGSWTSSWERREARKTATASCLVVRCCQDGLWFAPVELRSATIGTMAIYNTKFGKSCVFFGVERNGE